MKRIAIAEGDGLWLQSHGHGDDRRFAELFAATWRACYAQTEIAPVGVAVSRHRHGLDPQADIREPSRHPTSLPADQGTGASCDPKLCHRQSHPAIGQEKRCQAALPFWAIPAQWQGRTDLGRRRSRPFRQKPRTLSSREDSNTLQASNRATCRFGPRPWSHSSRRPSAGRSMFTLLERVSGQFTIVP